MNRTRPVRKIVIVGGGTAGWITAALMVKILGRALEITLVESDQIGIVGVGEATIPPIVDFNNALGIQEGEFLKATNGTVKLGIQFENWARLGDSYMHAFGGIGKDFPFCTFHHFWVRSYLDGGESSFWDYSLNYQAARRNRYERLARIEDANLPGLSYAYHFDASAYATFLRGIAERLGVKRVEGIVRQVVLNGEDGYVDRLEMEDGSSHAGDLYIDCSGFRGLLIEQALNTGYEDWTRWLPCDRAIAVPCQSAERIEPYTRSIAHHAGWQWRIPLQHRTGNGLVFSSRYMSEDEASDYLLAHLDGEALAEPRVIPFKTGRRNRQWNRNVVAIGLSSGFLEPLESTSIHLIQSSVSRLLKLFPQGGINQAEVDEFNRQSAEEIEFIRDFIVLHYHQNQRQDSEFWQECRRMDIPEGLRRKMNLFSQSGKVFRYSDELFTEIAWQQVMIGQHLVPKDHHPLVNALSSEQLNDMLRDLKTIIDGTVSRLSLHEDYLRSVSG